MLSISEHHELIEAVGLEKTYLRGSERVVALQSIDLTVQTGEFIVYGRLWLRC